MKQTHSIAAIVLILLGVTGCIIAAMLPQTQEETQVGKLTLLPGEWADFTIPISPSRDQGTYTYNWFLPVYCDYPRTLTKNIVGDSRDHVVDVHLLACGYNGIAGFLYLLFRKSTTTR